MQILMWVILEKVRCWYNKKIRWTDISQKTKILILRRWKCISWRLKHGQSHVEMGEQDIINIGLWKGDCQLVPVQMRDHTRIFHWFYQQLNISVTETKTKRECLVNEHKMKQEKEEFSSNRSLKIFQYTKLSKSNRRTSPQ